MADGDAKMEGEKEKSSAGGGGFVVTFETVVTLHQCALFEGEEEETDSGGDGNSEPSASFYWEVLQYGMPVVIANSSGVAFCLADIESGDKICEFPIWSSSQYVTIDNHFHIIAEPTGCYGFSFDDSTIGEKVLVLLKRAVSCPSFTGGDGKDLEPSAKQRRIEDDSAGGNEDEVDGPFGRRKPKHKVHSLEISEPKDFEHISHVGADTSISLLTEAMSWTDTLKRRKNRMSGECSIGIPVYSLKEVDTVSTTSFVEVKEVQEIPASPPGPPPGPPPPPAPPPPAVAPPPARVVLKKKNSATSSNVSSDLMSSLANEIKKGVVLRPVGSGSRSSIGSHSSDRSYDSLQDELKSGVVLRSLGANGRVMTLPPPPRRNQSEKLLFEITTFRRTKLRHVTSSTSITSSPSDKSLESIMKRGFDSMMEKMSVLDTTNVINVSKEGGENFDVLFATTE